MHATNERRQIEIQGIACPSHELSQRMVALVLDKDERRDYLKAERTISENERYVSARSVPESYAHALEKRALYVEKAKLRLRNQELRERLERAEERIEALERLLWNTSMRLGTPASRDWIREQIDKELDPTTQDEEVA